LAVVHAPHQLDHIAATATTGKAVPEIFSAIDDEGLWVICVVYGTQGRSGAGRAVSGNPHQPPGAQHPLDAEEALEMGKG